MGSPFLDDIPTQVARGMHWLWRDHALSCVSAPRKITVAKWEIHMRLGIVDALWWKFIPGEVVEVKWPRGWHPLDETGEVDCETSDPNTAYRWYLEKYVGKQGWDWAWKVGNFDSDSLFIKIRKKKSHMCSILALKWG